MGAPTLTSQVPTPNATNMVKQPTIAFTIADTGTQVVLGSIEVTIDGISAVLAGVVQSSYSGSIVANGLGWDLALVPDAAFALGKTINVQVEAAEAGPGTLNETYSFRVTSLEVTGVDVAVVRADGGTRIAALGSFPGTDYRMALGPVGDMTDPPFQSGNFGQGSTLQSIGGATLRGYSPVVVSNPSAYTLSVLDVVTDDVAQVVSAIRVAPAEGKPKVVQFRANLPLQLRG